MTAVRKYSDGVTHRKPNGVKLRPTGALTITPQAQVTRNVIRDGINKGSEPDRYDRPTLAQRDDGVWVMVYRTGSHHEETNDGLANISFLKPDGTWTEQNVCLDGSAVVGLPSQATPGDQLGPSEAHVYKCPNGDLLIQSWDVDYNVSNNGTWQTRSTDGGETWGPWSKVEWVGLASAEWNYIFATEDWFIYDNTLYAIARYYDEIHPYHGRGLKAIFVKTDDNGVTWDYVSDVIAWQFDGDDGGNEFSLEYLGNNRLVSFIRANGNEHTHIVFSDDFGATWGTPVRIDITEFGGLNFFRVRTYTDSHLKGRANWWNDPLIVNNGFTNQTPPDGFPRRNGIVLSNDRCANLTGIQYVDDYSDDAGYGDLYFNDVTQKYCGVFYFGDKFKSDIVEYQFEVEW